MTWEIVYTKQAQKDAKKLVEAGLKDKASELLEIIRETPSTLLPGLKNWWATLPAPIRVASIQHRLRGRAGRRRLQAGSLRYH